MPDSATVQRRPSTLSKVISWKSATLRNTRKRMMATTTPRIQIEKTKTKPTFTDRDERVSPMLAAVSPQPSLLSEHLGCSYVATAIDWRSHSYQASADSRSFENGGQMKKGKRAPATITASTVPNAARITARYAREDCPGMRWRGHSTPSFDSESKDRHSATHCSASVRSAASMMEVRSGVALRHRARPGLCCLPRTWFI